MKTVRLKKDLENNLKKYAKRNKVSESEVIREALTAYITKQEKQESSYSIGKNYFGNTGSGKTTNSQRYKSELKSKIREKASG